MDYLFQIKDYFLDFIFPKNDNLHRIESLSSGELLNLLPKSKEIADDNLIVLFDYRDPQVREMIWELKYKGNRKIARKFAEIIVDILRHEISERFLFENFINPLLIPVPVSNKRRRERGWNQTEILAEEIVSVLKNSDEDLAENFLEYSPKTLIKHKHTDSQARTHATKRERIENLRDSMSIEDTSKILDRHVILLDDVTTSGATLNEAKLVLKSAGAKTIISIALAH